MAPFAPMHETFASYMTELLSFRPRLQCKRSGPGAPPPMMLSARDVEARIMAKYGARDTNTCESLFAETIVKPYFDFERYHDSKPADHVISAVNTNNIDVLDTMFHYDSVPYSIVPSNRCGWVKKGGKEKYKVSFRYVVQGFCLKVRDGVCRPSC